LGKERDNIRLKKGKNEVELPSRGGKKPLERKKKNRGKLSSRPLVVQTGGGETGFTGIKDLFEEGSCWGRVRGEARGL